MSSPAWEGTCRTTWKCTCSGGRPAPHAQPLRRAAREARGRCPVFLTRRGVCASTQVEVGAFTRTSPQTAHPDIQYHFFPFLLEGWRPSRSESGFCVCVGTLRGRSRGTVRLACAIRRRLRSSISTISTIRATSTTCEPAFTRRERSCLSAPSTPSAAIPSRPGPPHATMPRSTR